MLKPRKPLSESEKTHKKAQEEAWLKENAKAIEVYNERIAKEGLLIRPCWLKKEE